MSRRSCTVLNVQPRFVAGMDGGLLRISEARARPLELCQVSRGTYKDAAQRACKGLESLPCTWTPKFASRHPNLNLITSHKPCQNALF